MFSTGLHKDKCRASNRLPVVSRDWVTFKLIFTTVARELRKTQVLSGNTGYVNSVQQDVMDQTALVFTNLTNSTAKDKATVSSVAMANHTLAQQLARTTKVLLLIQTRLKAIKTQLGMSDGNGNGGRE